MRLLVIALALAGCGSSGDPMEKVSADEAKALNDAAEMLEEHPANASAQTGS